MVKRLVRVEWITVDCSSSFQTFKKFHCIIYLVSTIRGKIDKGTPSRLVIIELHSIYQKKNILTRKSSSHFFMQFLLWS